MTEKNITNFLKKKRLETKILLSIENIEDVLLYNYALKKKHENIKHKYMKIIKKRIQKSSKEISIIKSSRIPISLKKYLPKHIKNIKHLLNDISIHEINKLLKELFYDESWMDDNDYKEVIELTFKTTDITKQKLSDSIEIGIKNGYNVEQQIELLRKYLNAA